MQILAIKNILKQGFFGILLTFDAIVYGLIGGAFKVFMAVAKARLLTSDAYYNVANKVYLIVGVLMLFVLSYAILRAIIDPDQATKGELGPKMIQRVVIAVVGLAITPAIFNVLYQAQGLFMEKDVLAKIFFNKNSQLTVQSYNASGSVNIDQQIKTIGGAVTATSIWQAFFSPADGYNADDVKTNPSEYFADAALEGALCAAGIGTSIAIATGALAIPVIGWIVSPLILGATVVACVSTASDLHSGAQSAAATNGKEYTLAEAYAASSGGGGFMIYVAFLDNYVEKGEISYLYIISTICGLFVLYSFVSFTIDMGVRAAKLAYLQVVAPIPLVMQVLPKYKDTFTKWYKSVFSAFAEVFIRISVVYIVVYVICHLSDVFSAVSKGFANSDLNTLEAALAYAALIMGLIAFCRKAPNIIQQTLGISGGDLKFGLGEKLKDGGVFAATAIGHGGITSAVRGFRNFDRDKWKKEHGMEGNRNADALANISHLMAGLGGLGAGASRATWNQFGDLFGGKAKQEANNFHDAIEKGEQAAQQHMDAVGRAEERRSQHYNAIQARNEAETNLNKANQDLNQANANLVQAQADFAAGTITQAQLDSVQDAQKKAQEAQAAAVAAYNEADNKVSTTTAVGAFGQNVRRRVSAWSVGSVDMTTEETAMKLASDVKGLQDALRAEALKKDDVSKSLAAQYEKLKAETIGDFRAGWDQETYNKKLHELLENDTGPDGYVARRAAYEAARTAFPTAEANLTQARSEYEAAQAAADADPTNATKAAEAASKRTVFQAAQAAYTSAQTNLQDARARMDEKQKDITDGLDAKAKLSEPEKATLRADLQARVEAAKQVSEAAQDAWVQAKLASGDNELSRIVESAITPHLEFLQTHGDDTVVVDIDPQTGAETRIKISDLVTGFGGSDTIIADGRVDPKVVARSSKFVLSDDRIDPTTGKKFDPIAEFTYDAASETYTDADGHTFQAGEMAAHIQDLMAAMRRDNPGAKPKFEGKTAVNNTKDKGKKVGINTPRSKDYRAKIQRRREAEGNKGGKK